MAAPSPQTLRSINLLAPISDTLSLLRGQLEQAAIMVRTEATAAFERIARRKMDPELRKEVNAVMKQLDGKPK